MIELNAFLPYRLATLSEQLSASFAGVYADKYQLTIPQWRVIAHLAAERHLTAKTICERAGLDKSTASRAVKQLLERDIVYGKQSPEDKRATVLGLSDKGQTLYQELSKDANSWQNALFEVLNHNDKETLFRILDKLDRK